MATKTLRILVNTEIDEKPYKCNTLVDLDEKKADALVKAGVADGSKPGVDYLLSQGVKPVVHGATAKAAE